MAATITRDELKTAIDAGEVTDETLSAEHFEQGHLPAAIHNHFEQIAEKHQRCCPSLLPGAHFPSCGLHRIHPRAQRAQNDESPMALVEPMTSALGVSSRWRDAEERERRQRCGSDDDVPARSHFCLPLLSSRAGAHLRVPAARHVGEAQTVAA
ncbi:MAG TPA: hypothetical protein VGR11_00640 [Solirubrobacteraceae bacterium]|nr:hypothetical protein [Solirubrobacteraceae bacterium]